jgi:4-hydroxybenzoate polyprenyltransferase
VLRVFDEHKDYELDCTNHPQRVLQSGMISLKHLKVLAVVSIIAQLLFSLWQDQGFADVSIAWLIAFTWTCLMGVEFFCGEWLEKRLTLYAFSHMLVTPMIMWWLAQLAAPSVVMSNELILMLCFAFVGGFTAEIVRKTRGPEEERDTVDSYSKIFGTQGSAWVVMFLLLLTGAIQTVLCNQMSSGSFVIGYLVLAVGYLLAVISLLKFVKAPSLKGREKK